MCATELRILVFAALCVTTGCASTGAPRGFLSDTVEAQTDAYGGWIDVAYRESAGNARIRGELIAMTPDSLWVLGSGSSSVIVTSAIIGGRLVAYDPGARDTGLFTALGTVSTISNGAFLIFTAPMWLIGGSLASSSQSKVPVSDLSESGWQDISRFARFPQGMPDGLSLSDLEPKPTGGR